METLHDEILELDLDEEAEELYWWFIIRDEMIESFDENIHTLQIAEDYAVINQPPNRKEVI